MAVCGASYPTGGTAAGGPVHRQCGNDAEQVRFARLPSGWAIHFHLCGPHAELWDDESAAAATMTFVARS